MLEYECKGRKGSSLVEFSVLLDYFKDVTLFFMKSCDGGRELIVFIGKSRIFIVEDVPYQGHSEFWAIFIWMIVLFLMSCILATLYNIFVKKKKGYESVPGLEKSIKIALANKFIRESVRILWIFLIFCEFFINFPRFLRIL